MNPLDKIIYNPSGTAEEMKEWVDAVKRHPIMKVEDFIEKNRKILESKHDELTHEHETEIDEYETFHHRSTETMSIMYLLYIWWWRPQKNSKKYNLE